MAIAVEVGGKYVPHVWRNCPRAHDALKQGATHIEIVGTDPWERLIYVAKDDRGNTYQVKYDSEDGRTCESCYGAEDLKPYTFFTHVVITKPKKTIMTSVKNFIINGMRSAEDKALIKAGMLDECGDLTRQGELALLAYLLKENKTKFVTDVVQPFLEEQKSEDK